MRVLSAAPLIVAVLTVVHFPVATAQVNCSANPNDPSCQQSRGDNSLGSQQQPQPNSEQQFCSDVNRGNFAAASALLPVLGQTSLITAAQQFCGIVGLTPH